MSETCRSLVAPLAGSVDRNSALVAHSAASRPSLPSRGAWIEIFYFNGQWCSLSMSLPSRGAWIEIVRYSRPLKPPKVAPLAGSVDRNLMTGRWTKQGPVAPLAGSVDRNMIFAAQSRKPMLSLPSRGAWIEIY